MFRRTTLVPLEMNVLPASARKPVVFPKTWDRLTRAVPPEIVHMAIPFPQNSEARTFTDPEETTIAVEVLRVNRRCRIVETAP